MTTCERVSVRSDRTWGTEREGVSEEDDEVVETTRTTEVTGDQRPHTYTLSDDGATVGWKRLYEVVSHKQSPDLCGVKGVVPSMNWNPQSLIFGVRTRVVVSQSRTWGPHKSTPNRWTVVRLYFGQLFYTEYGVSLWVPVVSYIFVLRGKFPFDVCNFPVVGGVYSFLATFLKPLRF